jgi:hypothetical protein
MNVRRSLAFGAPVLVGTIAAVLSIGGAAGASTGFSLSPRHAAPTAMTQTVISSVRVSSHSDFDRITFTFQGPQPGYDIAYRPRITSEPMDRVVTLSGSAFLQVMLHPTSTVTPAPQRSITPGFPRVKQVKGAGDFEALTVYGIGVGARAPFRATRLSNPPRLVIDVADPGPTLPKTGPANLPLTFTGFTLLFTGLALRAGTRKPGAGARSMALPRLALPRLVRPAAGIPAGLLQPTGRRRRDGTGPPPERHGAPPKAPASWRGAVPRPRARPRGSGRPAEVDRIVYLSFVEPSATPSRTPD